MGTLNNAVIEGVSERESYSDISRLRRIQAYEEPGKRGKVLVKRRSEKGITYPKFLRQEA